MSENERAYRLLFASFLSTQATGILNEDQMYDDLQDARDRLTPREIESVESDVREMGRLGLTAADAYCYMVMTCESSVSSVAVA